MCLAAGGMIASGQKYYNFVGLLSTLGFLVAVDFKGQRILEYTQSCNQENLMERKRSQRTSSINRVFK